ncbi:energy-coupling factor ABC transporter ATP-binding protein [Anaerophilus nitritogenes]|uniref:energy-coupling factor ABC transporter ATP-binding protein n=1 Tax=Anaerophilus nitritogenes TaxID=2498136 RepID=UPI00101D247D|nr:ABC transporter ATP-binding protein [Anaerophilus nitritogenes]
MTVLNMKDVSFGYEKKYIIENISLKISSNEKLGLIGPNGAGKTTLFYLMSGIYKPKKGEIFLYDKKVIAGKFYPKLGMIFQNPDDQLIHPSVWDDIAFGPTNMGLSHDDIEKRVEDALKILHIEKLKDRVPHQLSGGEKRLVAIAGILAMKSSFVIYDEPTSNLDMRHRRLLIDFLKTSTEDARIIASHDLEFILESCDRVIVFDHGKIQGDGHPKEILSNAQLMEEHGLEVPYSLR